MVLFFLTRLQPTVSFEQDVSIRYAMYVLAQKNLIKYLYIYL